MSKILQFVRTKLQVPAGFDDMGDDKLIRLYRLKNKNGLEATITNYGARLVGLLAPNGCGDLINIIAAPDRPPGMNDSNDISRTVIWHAGQIEDHTVELGYFFRNAEGGFPGNLRVKRSFFLNDDNNLKITYEAATDKTIVMNLANNIFFNLNGKNNGNILNHQLWIRADNYMPIDANMQPTGDMEAVIGTPFDFRNSATIGSRINDHHPQLNNGNGYDHNFVLNDHASRSPVAKIKGDKSGIIMEIFTDQPGLHFYSGNFIKSKQAEKDNDKDDSHMAFAMKIRHFADLLTSTRFPLTALRRDHVFRSVSVYRFKN